MDPSTAIPWREIRVLSFDVYGTLINEDEGLYNSLKSSPLGPHLSGSRQEVLDSFEKTERAVHEELPNLLQFDANAECVRRYAANLELVSKGKLSEQEIEAAAREFGTSSGTWPAYPDTVAALQSLGKRYKLAPLSNIDRKSFSGTCAGPLAGVDFDAKYLAEDIGSYKPDLRNFDYLLEHVQSDFGASSGQLVLVAQGLTSDHLPAQKVAGGLQTVWVDRNGIQGAESDEESMKAHSAEYGYRLRVQTLSELAGIVERAWSEA